MELSNEPDVITAKLWCWTPDRPSVRTGAASHGLLTLATDGGTGYSMLQGHRGGYPYALSLADLLIIEIPIVITKVHTKHYEQLTIMHWHGILAARLQNSRREGHQ